MLVNKGELTQNAVETTLNMLQAELAQQAQKRDETLQLWLALIGIMLAGPQFVSTELATLLLQWAKLPQPAAGYNILLLLAIQIVGTIIVGLIIWLLVRVLSGLRGR